MGLGFWFEVWGSGFGVLAYPVVSLGLFFLVCDLGLYFGLGVKGVTGLGFKGLGIQGLAGLYVGTQNPKRYTQQSPALPSPRKQPRSL